jgi:hypothetical protein
VAEEFADSGPSPSLSDDLFTTDRSVQQERRPPINLLREWLLIVGGALMVIGSFEPWTYGSIANFTISRNGMQLSFNDQFSAAGLLTVIFGAFVTLSGAMLLARRSIPRITDPLLLMSGLIGVGIGLYGLGEAKWYVGQMLAKSTLTGIIGASTGYGIWLIVLGGTSVLVAAILSKDTSWSGYQRVMVSLVVAVIVAGGALSLAQL